MISVRSFIPNPDDYAAIVAIYNANWAMEFARQLDASTIETDDDENNTMVDLNLKLGFQPEAVWVSYRWELPQAAVSALAKTEDAKRDD